MLVPVAKFIRIVSDVEKTAPRTWKVSAIVVVLAGRPAERTVKNAWPFVFVWFKAHRRRNAFEAQLPDLLISLAASLKAGHSFKQGLQRQDPQTGRTESVVTHSKQLVVVDSEGRFRGYVDGTRPEELPRLENKIRALVAAGETAEAKEILDGLSDDLAKKPEIARAMAALEIAVAPTADTGPLEQRLAANPEDHEARFELAAAKMAAGDRDGAADDLLELIRDDREWNEGAARKRFLQLLEAQGLEDPWSSAQRRRLSAVLFT